MRLRRLGAAAAAIACAGAAAVSSQRLEEVRAGIPGGSQVLYLPSGRYLKVMSLGFPEVLADMVYIWSIQYYGNYEARNRFEYLDHIYSGVISELDPRYVDPYLIGALIMSVEARDHEMALRLLDKGMAANPDEWILPFEAGFTCYNTLKDYARAARYFEKAIEAPGAPVAIRRMHAEMYNKMGDKRSSLDHWREVYEGADNDYVRDVASRHVHDLTIEVDLETLNGAVGRWRAARGGNPPDLDALVGAGLLARVPIDPDGLPYAYDARTGLVSSQARFQLRRRAS